MNLFSDARIKLTLIYLLLVLLISGSLSLLFYRQTSLILEERFIRMEKRFLKENFGNLQGRPAPIARAMFIEPLSMAKQQIAIHLIVINGVILVLFSATGYLLSGFTLAPIANSMQAQKRFIENAAHELRTPIAAMKTSLEVALMDKKISQDMQTVLQNNLGDVISLEMLSESLLKLGQDHAEAVEVFTLDEIVKRAQSHIFPLAKKKGLNLEILDFDKEIKINMNKTDMLEILLALLSNAVKYSLKQGNIRLKIMKQQKQLIIEVKDDGVGIDKKHLPYVCDRFYRVEESRSDSSSYGIGLAITKSIIERYSGKLDIISASNKGSTFKIKLPVIV